MDETTINQLIKDLVKTEPAARNAEAYNIAVIFNYDKKPGKNVLKFARIFRIPDAIKPITSANGFPVDFVIEYFIQTLDKVCKDPESEFGKLLYHRITLHELMHVSEDGKLVPHDTQDFRYLIEKYGIDWANAQTALDFDKAKKDK